MDGLLVRLATIVWNNQCIIVGYAGYIDVLLARLLATLARRPLVLVAFISLYDTIVVDRQQVSAGSWKASLLKTIDRMAFSAADLVLVDTQEHVRYFVDLFGLLAAKYQRSFVGEDDELFRPGRNGFQAQVDSEEGASTGDSGRQRTFRVLFFGTYVPLHGIEYIIEAADILRALESVEFTLIGNGQMYPEIRDQVESLHLERVRLLNQWVCSRDLVSYIEASDVCLGIFGATEKAGRVIPYKVYDALAMGRPVITRDSPAIRELLVHEETALLCDAGSGPSLAESLVRLHEDPRFSVELSQRGRTRFLERGSPRAIGKELLRSLQDRYGG